MSCGRPRAQVTCGHSPVRCKVALKPKLISIVFSQRIWKSIPAKELTKGDCEFASTSKHLTKNLRHTGCDESDGAVRWDHFLQACQELSKIKNWNKEDWIDTFSRSTDKLRMEYCEDQNGTIGLLLTWVELVSDLFDRLFLSPLLTSLPNPPNSLLLPPPTPQTINACVGASVGVSVPSLLPNPGNHNCAEKPMFFTKIVRLVLNACQTQYFSHMSPQYDENKCFFFHKN